MPPQVPQGPFCQSCSMPLDKAEDFGTAADGTRSKDYCHFCFSGGRFTDPDISLPAMIDLCVDVLVSRGMPSAEARALMAGVLPGLKRWRTPATTAG